MIAISDRLMIICSKCNIVARKYQVEVENHKKQTFFGIVTHTRWIIKKLYGISYFSSIFMYQESGQRNFKSCCQSKHSKCKHFFINLILFYLASS